MKKINLFTMAVALMVMSMSFSTSLSAQFYGPNLVVNGDFSNGNIDFFTEYNYIDAENPVQGIMSQEGTYTVASDPSLFKADWVGAHPDRGNFMFVNGATYKEMCPGATNSNQCNVNWIVWQQDVNIEQGKEYEFSFMLTGISTQNPDVIADLNITVVINGDTLSEVTLDDYAYGTPGQWFHHTWTAIDKSENATITIIETSTIKNGNDFGIDDIVFRSVTPEPDPCPEFAEVVTVNVVNVSCPGDEDGIIELILNGAKPFNACISFGCDTDYNEEELTHLKTSIYTYNGLLPGSYNITIVDGNGCVFKECVTVGEPDPVSFELTYADILCNGERTNVTVTGMGSNPPYTLFNEHNEAVGTFDNEFTLAIGAGDYNWTISDYHGCEPAVISFRLTEPEPLEVSEIATQDVSCFGSEDGIAWISVTAGTAPYTSDMGTFTIDMLEIDNLAAESYDVKIYDANQCHIETSFMIGQPEKLIVNVDDIEVPLCVPENFAGCEEPFITEVLEYEVGTAQYGGGMVAENRKIIENVLGAPDYSNSGNNGITFTTLGFGGHMIVELGCNIIDGQGDDLIVVETSYGQTNCDNYPEKAEIAVSQFEDGPWSILGVNCLTGGADLATGKDETGAPFVLSTARFVRITDVTALTDFNNGDGFDLNGIEILNTAGSGTLTASATFSFSGVSEGISPVFTVMLDDSLISVSNSTELDGLLPGTYTLVLTADDCSSSPVEFIVPSFPEPIEAAAVVTDVFCNGDTDGFAEITISGGTSPYELIYDSMLSEQKDTPTQNINNLSAGTYTYIIIDANDCMSEVTFTVGEPEVLEASVETGMILCYGADTGIIEVSASGGTGDLTYSINGNEAQVSGLFTELLAGDYVITITDANGCSTDSDMITITEPEELTVDLTITNLSDEDEWTGRITGMISGGVGPYNVCLFTKCTVDDTKLGESLDKSMSIMYWGLSAGNYMIRVVDQNGCTLMECVEVAIIADDDYKDETHLSEHLMSIEDSKVKVYPNPFKTQATFEFNLTQTADVTLEVYNLIGERVAVVFQGTVNAFENNKVTFNTASLPNGIYIYKLTAGGYIFNDRVVITR